MANPVALLEEAQELIEAKSVPVAVQVLNKVGKYGFKKTAFL